RIDDDAIEADGKPSHGEPPAEELADQQRGMSNGVLVHERLDREVEHAFFSGRPGGRFLLRFARTVPQAAGTQVMSIHGNKRATRLDERLQTIQPGKYFRHCNAAKGGGQSKLRLRRNEIEHKRQDASLRSVLELFQKSWRDGTRVVQVETLKKCDKFRAGGG